MCVWWRVRERFSETISSRKNARLRCFFVLVVTMRKREEGKRKRANDKLLCHFVDPEKKSHSIMFQV